MEKDDNGKWHAEELDGGFHDCRPTEEFKQKKANAIKNYSQTI
jgi:hypothetical protein